MRWAMEAEEMEAVLERIWDLHDKMSDAIHAISRAHFLKSIRTLAKSSQDKVYPEAEVAGGGGNGGGDGEGAGCFVFVKGFRTANDEAAMAEAKGLNAIRTALENLEDRLEYFHVSIVLGINPTPAKVKFGAQPDAASSHGRASADVS